MLRYLMDTHIVIYVLKWRPVEVLSTFNANASRMAISSMTLAELLHGADSAHLRSVPAAVPDVRWSDAPDRVHYRGTGDFESLQEGCAPGARSASNITRLNANPWW